MQMMSMIMIMDAGRYTGLLRPCSSPVQKLTTSNLSLLKNPFVCPRPSFLLICSSAPVIYDLE